MLWDGLARIAGCLVSRGPAKLSRICDSKAQRKSSDLCQDFLVGQASLDKAINPRSIMSIQSSFHNAQPATASQPQIVLRFQGLHPKHLGRFEMHDRRRGGDLSHVDLAASALNEPLHGAPDWKETIHAEIAFAMRNNFAEHQKGLRAKSRKSELAALQLRGESDPWRHSKGRGPLREGILTVSKAWFGGAGYEQWDPQKLEEFKKTAMAFLRENFIDGQLRYASGHVDEEAFHIHFVAVIWTEKVSKNRGRQACLQASVNPLLRSYEYAQDLAGEAFASLGIERGARSAEARRLAKAAGIEIPAARRHVAPSEWRATQRLAAKAEAAQIKSEAQSEAKSVLAEAKTLGQVTIQKCRKRAVKDARKRHEVAARQCGINERAAAVAICKSDAAKAALDHMEGKRLQVLADTSLAKGEYDQLQSSVADARKNLDATQRSAEAIKVRHEGVRAEIASAEAKRDHLLAEVAEQGAKLGDLIQLTDQQERVLAKVQTARAGAQSQLVDLRTEVDAAQTQLDRLKSMITKLRLGVEMIGQAILNWQPSPSDEYGKLSWGPNAPQDREQRSAMRGALSQVGAWLLPLARVVTEAVEGKLTHERQKLAVDAAYLLDLREDWQVQQQEEMTRIAQENAPRDLGRDGPDF
jgi:hypothetical protein